jgi:hypothetical protein
MAKKESRKCAGPEYKLILWISVAISISISISLSLVVGDDVGTLGSPSYFFLAPDSR